jgi:hypothetical protein
MKVWKITSILVLLLLLSVHPVCADITEEIEYEIQLYTDENQLWMKNEWGFAGYNMVALRNNITGMNFHIYDNWNWIKINGVKIYGHRNILCYVPDSMKFIDVEFGDLYSRTYKATIRLRQHNENMVWIVEAYALTPVTGDISGGYARATNGTDIQGYNCHTYYHTTGTNYPKHVDFKAGDGKLPEYVYTAKPKPPRTPNP